MGRDGWTENLGDDPEPAKPDADKSPREGETFEDWKDRVGGGA